ncbi:MAG: general secretion pathway protein GspK [Planctomycetia bacterium]|nr:general secretion pathway protein GspK [Planctomycetia bacterium]
MAHVAKGKSRRKYDARGPAGSPARAAMVLVLVLIVVVMIALAGFSFAELMLTENKATHLHGDELRLEQAIGSGVEFLKWLCEQPAEKQNLVGGLYNNPTLLRGIPLVPEDRSIRRAPSHQAHFSVIAPLMQEGEVSGIRFGVENESGRLHLADLLRWDQQQPGSGRKALLNFPGMTPAVADAILDWIDADRVPRETGAETEYYAGLEQPYAPRNGLPECLEELLLVKGVTRELLFGADANYNHQIEPEELARASTHERSASQGLKTTPWASLLTLYSGQRNLTSDGRPRVDLNGMDLTKLFQQLIEALDPNWAGFIVAYRQYGPYFGADPGVAGVPPPDVATGPRFMIGSVLDVVGTRVAIPGAAGQPAKVYASPAAGDAASSSQQLPKLLDKTTVIGAPVLRGGVSVNHAPRAVLLCVPGMDDALAGRIIAARDSQTNKDDLSRRYPTWLLSEGVVDLPRMRTLLPNLSAGGDVVRAQIVGHFDGGGPSARAEIVIDAATVPARQVVWNDLRLWGTGYPLEYLAADGASAGDYRRRGRGDRAGAAVHQSAGRNAR